MIYLPTSNGKLTEVLCCVPGKDEESKRLSIPKPCLLQHCCTSTDKEHWYLPCFLASNAQVGKARFNWSCFFANNYGWGTPRDLEHSRWQVQQHQPLAGLMHWNEKWDEDGMDIWRFFVIPLAIVVVGTCHSGCRKVIFHILFGKKSRLVKNYEVPRCLGLYLVWKEWDFASPGTLISK